MKSDKTLGIWMDHSQANLIDLHVDILDYVIRSEFTFETKEKALTRGEKHMHSKEQHMHDAYYKDLGEVMKGYDHILLFGPTDAKTELYNYLKKEQHFKDIQIDVEPADKMTDHEKVAFVKNHFAKVPG